MNKIVSNKELIAAFDNADFGKSSKRTVIKFALLKYASGFESGMTATLILKELKLIDVKCNLTKKGKQYLWAAFSGGYN